MKILFLTDNFPPERNAPASRTFEHALEWVKAGHEVTVITTAPNFPEGKLFDGYENRAISREELSGIHVVRVISLISPNSGFLRRTLDYLSFMVSGGIAALFERRPDVLVTTSPQFFCAMAGWIVSRIRRTPWVFELRDLWPASIVALGAVKNSLPIRILEWIELRMYRDADAIVAVSKSFVKNLVSRGVRAEKIHLVMNGVDLARYQPIPKDAHLLDTFNLRGKFVVGYLGTHGLSHALDKVVDAAERLRHRDDITFVFAGAGAKRADIESAAQRRGLSNICMVPAQPKEMMQRLWSIHDLALIPLANHELFRTVIPSKMFEAMGMGIPILMSVPAGEATELLAETGAGLSISPEDPEQMAAAIVSLADNRARLAEYSRSALQIANHFSRAQQAALMLQVLTRVAAKNKGNTIDAQVVPGSRSPTKFHEGGPSDSSH